MTTSSTNLIARWRDRHPVAVVWLLIAVPAAIGGWLGWLVAVTR